MYSLDNIVFENNLEKINVNKKIPCEISESALNFLIKKNNHEIIKSLIENKVKLPFFSYSIMSDIIFGNSLKIIDILVNPKYKDSFNSVRSEPDDILFQACVLGKLSVVKHLINNYNANVTLNNNVCFSMAYQNKHKEVFLYLLSIPIVTNALKKTHKDIFEDLIKIKVKDSINVF